MIIGNLTLSLSACIVIGLSVPSIATGASGVKANEYVWLQFSAPERLALLSKFPNIELIPVTAVGIIQAAQVVNRSTPPSHGGAALGGVVGQAAYIDHAFKGSRSNYSAVTHVGAALLGAAIGSSLDSPGRVKYVLSYGIRTADGQVREVRTESPEEITKPVGQCVYLADLSEAAPSLCVADKVQFLKQLSSGEQGSGPGEASTLINRSVNCRLTNVGLMTLTLAACQELQGMVEK